MLLQFTRCAGNSSLQQAWKNVHAFGSKALPRSGMIESRLARALCTGRPSNRDTHHAGRDCHFESHCQQKRFYSLLQKANEQQILPKLLQPTSGTSFTGIHTSGVKHVYEDHETKSLTVWKDLKELPRSPLPALTLGLSGLIPFLSAPLYLIYAQQFVPSVVFAQFAYGVTILSFLGGVRWGASLQAEGSILPDWKNLSYSVMPSLVAWLSLLVPSQHYCIALGTLMTGMGVTAYFDIFMQGYPGWFKGLRFVLSLFAILSLWTSFVLSFLLEETKEESDSSTEQLS